MNESNSTRRRAGCMHWSKGWLVLAFALSAGCAVPVRQLNLQQPLVPTTGQGFVLLEDARCAVGTGYGRTLRRGTRWNQFGTIERGDVYRSPDQTLTVEGYNVHEAYLVVKEAWLVGFYLPVEKTFTPVSKNVKLSITQQ